MSDQERELTPRQEAEVRRLLGEARVTDPVPPEVADRLDRVLVGLGAERDGAPPVAPGHVVALASRRRRATYLMVAAAAVVIVGIGLGQLADNQSSNDSDSAGGAADTGASAQRDEQSQEDGVSGAAPEAQAPSEGPGLDPGASLPPLSETRVGRVREENFTADVNQLRRALPETAVDGEFVQLTADQLPSGYVLGPRAFDCAPARWGDGVLVPVYVDGTPAVLAYRPVTGDAQVVDLLQCGTGDKLRSTTLQAG